MYKIESSADFYLGTISCSGFTIGLLANLIVVSHLLKKSWNRSKTRSSSLTRASLTSRDILLVMLTVVDGVITVIHVVCGISLLSTDAGVFKVGEFCITWGMLWNISIRLSAFTVLLLAVDLIHEMRGRVVVGLFFAYFLLQVSQSTIPFWRGYSYKYSKFKDLCTWGNIFTLRSPSWMAYNLVVEILEFFVPNTITLVLVFKNILFHRNNKHSPLSPDGTERDTDFLYNPFQDTSSRSSDKPSSVSSSETSKPQTSRRTVLAVALAYTFLSLPQILIAVLEFSQIVQGTKYVFTSFPPDLGRIKMYAVIFYSVGVAARAWVNPIVFLIGERRRVFRGCCRG